SVNASGLAPPLIEKCVGQLPPCHAKHELHPHGATASASVVVVIVSRDSTKSRSERIAVRPSESVIRTTKKKLPLVGALTARRWPFDVSVSHGGSGCDHGATSHVRLPTPVPASV